MKIRTVLTTAAVAAALVAGGIAGPAVAAGPPVAGIDMTQVPTGFTISKSCSIISVPVAFSGGSADGIYLVRGTISSGTAYPISLSQYAVDELPNTPIVLTSQICSDTKAGPQTVTIGVADYSNSDAAGNPTVTTAVSTINLKAYPEVEITSVSGKLKKTATKKAVGYASHNAIGAVVKVYYKKSGAKKYKYIGKTRVHTAKGYTTVGKWVFKSKKLGTGKMYVKISATKKLKGSKSPNLKLVKRSY